MKAILFAAAALVAVPTFAQTTTTPATGDQAMPMQSTTTPPTDSTMTPAPTDTTAMPQSDTTTPAPTDGTMPQSTPPMATGGMATGGMAPGETAGGYQPSAPAMQGTMQPGATVRFQPAQTPDQAYPAPAPMAKYPVCKKGQYDNCLQAHSPK